MPVADRRIVSATVSAEIPRSASRSRSGTIRSTGFGPGMSEPGDRNIGSACIASIRRSAAVEVASPSRPRMPADTSRPPPSRNRSNRAPGIVSAVARLARNSETGARWWRSVKPTVSVA
ncbi:hypothetical protein GCM10011341_18480 [Frigidibacter albus]|nr:hypothetical protein GCM10011341_18480 [Frigidibacter albus]